ncbi:sugar ABC transporter ATP-binding protein [Saliterribacillus persicus]|uniref:Monosaccharide ABC transporter ATP-binding protein (CUT2 family) n=1 Tax=Saliterribacillus persicus TaxID=930114 RepID=A0A368YGC2_9BACI|nr:sugar ABC transporter ATP-binding protein [Saliterribacillus persicus]RCW77234.1 monosaccharide ABC transporter ATP-binding protein (CUT2 family) [Saliterribacillus persicus]
MSSKILEMKNITKSFPGVKALSNVQLDLHHSEVLALIGENGAGKSTLMKILTGIYQKDEGTIVFDGKEIAPSNTKEAQELGINIIHQELNLMPDLTVAENIFIGREPRDRLNFFLKNHELNRKAEELFEKLNIQLNPRAKISSLTVAKQQMVEIAKALSFNAKVLIMDEPTAALTGKEINALFDIINWLKNEGVSIIYISHRMEELKQIADRITVMRDGEYIDTLPTNGTQIRQVVSLMVGREIKIQQKVSDPNQFTETILEVNNLKNKHVKDVSFELKKGEILGFAGLVGAGRTETARAIFGADPSSGSIKINGKKVSIKQPVDAVAHGIGYLSEDRKSFGLMLEMTVKENIVISTLDKYSVASFVKPAGISHDAKRYTKQLKVKTPSINQKVNLLSGGNQQKIVIAKWLLKNCDILIFDEPTRGIDVGAKQEIYDLLEVLADEGKSIIMISSELPEILRLSDRIVVMNEGRVTGELLSKDANQEKIMELATKHV